VVGESYSPSFVRQQSATYYFSVSPKYLAESDVEIHERAFGGDVGREDAFLAVPTTRSGCGISPPTRVRQAAQRPEPIRARAKQPSRSRSVPLAKARR